MRGPGFRWRATVRFRGYERKRAPNDPLRVFPGQWELALLQDPARAAGGGDISGRIAQLVEQLTLNQRVAGSSPARLTSISNDLRQVEEPAVFHL